MIIQSVEEVTACMKGDPSKWARLLLDQQEVMQRLIASNDELVILNNRLNANIEKLEAMLRIERGEKVTLQ